MFNVPKIALSVAIALSTASGAFAATKHHGHNGPVVHGRVSAAAFDADAAVNQIPGSGRSGETGAMLIQDRDFSSSNGNLPYCGGKC
jgi:hypothetical protein